MKKYFIRILVIFANIIKYKLDSNYDLRYKRICVTTILYNEFIDKTKLTYNKSQFLKKLIKKDVKKNNDLGNIKCCLFDSNFLVKFPELTIVKITLIDKFEDINCNFCIGRELDIEYHVLGDFNHFKFEKQLSAKYGIDLDNKGPINCYINEIAKEILTKWYEKYQDKIDFNAINNSITIKYLL
jgi:hypothetical protein